MEEADILASVERDLKDAHDSASRGLRSVRRRYPLVFLLILTFSIAAVFHGFDGMLEQFDPENHYPFILALGGIVGLFICGVLYKRLGSDKYE